MNEKHLGCYVREFAGCARRASRQRIGKGERPVPAAQRVSGHPYIRPVGMGRAVPVHLPARREQAVRIVVGCLEFRVYAGLEATRPALQWFAVLRLTQRMA